MTNKLTRFELIGMPLMVCGTVLAIFSPPAWPSGAYIHLAAAEKARAHFSAPMRSIVTGDYTQWYFGGAAFPDAMHAFNKEVGSWAHWRGFFNDAAAMISKNCANINASFSGATCKQLISFYIGAWSHVMVDYRFDAYLVKKTNANCFNDSGKAQIFTDEALDAVAVCKHKEHFRDRVIGKDKSFNIRVPDEFIVRVAREMGEKDAVKNLTKAQIQDAYDEWGKGTIREHERLLTRKVGPLPILCETILSTDKAGFPNPWKTCPWATDETHYWARPGKGNEPGSVEDLAHDYLPGQLQPVYNRLVNSLGDQPGRPVFRHNGKVWPGERIDLQP